MQNIQSDDKGNQRKTFEHAPGIVSVGPWEFKTLNTMNDIKHTPDKKVIDADRQVIVEMFDKKDTKEVLAKYKAKGKWNDVNVDRGGDIILWEE